MLLLVGAEARLDQVIRQLEKLHDVLALRKRPDLASEIFDLRDLDRREDGRSAQNGLATSGP